MGMFDMVANELFCPYCGKKQQKNDFQTKEFGNMMDTIAIGDMRVNTNIYASCRNCKKWIEIIVQPRDFKNDTAKSESIIEKMIKAKLSKDAIGKRTP